MRVNEADANERLLAALQARVAESQAVLDTITTVTLQTLWPIYASGEQGHALADLARDIYAELDGRTLLMHTITNGGTDVGLAGRSGVLEGLGLAGWATARGTNTSRSIPSHRASSQRPGCSSNSASAHAASPSP